MSDRETRWFASKVDWWMRVILLILPVGCLAALIAVLAKGGVGEIVITAIACALVGALYGLLIFPLRYGISAEELIIRHGVVRQRARLEAIQSVKRIRDPLSSPALSLDRLEVRTGPGFTGSILISPADQESFLALLEARAGLKREGDRLVRK